MDLVQVTPIVSHSTLLSFRSRLVRDLAWAITLPSIVKPEWPPRRLVDTRLAVPEEEPSGHRGESVPSRGDPPQHRVPVVTDPRFWLEDRFFRDGWRRMEPFLRELDRDDTQLRRVLEPYEGARHGIRYERLLAFWFDTDPAIDLVESDRQVFYDGTKRTKGQIDFVVAFEGEVIQIEVAVKFYLDLGLPTLDRYVGTDLSDRMADKLSHMLFHQRGVRSPEVAVPDRSVVSMRGTIYEPLREIPNRGLDHLPRWWWCDHPVFEGYAGHAVSDTEEDTRATRWTLGDSNLWFSPVSPEDASWISVEELLYHLERQRTPGRRTARLVIGGNSEGETTRGFVVTGP